MVCKIIVSPPKTIKCNTPFGLIVRCDDYNLMQRFISIYTDKFTATAYLRSPNGEPLNIDGGDWRSNFSLNQNEAQGKDAHIPHIEEGNYIDPDSGREFINAEMEERNIMPEVLEKGLYFRFRDLQIQRPAQSAGLEDGEIREFKIEIEFKSYDEDGHHLHGIRNPGTAVTGVITVSEEDTVEEHVIPNIELWMLDKYERTVERQASPASDDSTPRADGNDTEVEDGYATEASEVA